MGFAHLQQKNAKEIATCCIDLLPTLCTHLENCHNHFQVHTRLHSQPCVPYVRIRFFFYSVWTCLSTQTILSEHQGVVDAPGVDVKEQQLMCSAYQLLLQVLHTTFSWWAQTLLAVSWICWQLQTFLTIFNHPLFIFRAGFSGLEHRALLKSALGVLASRLKEEETDLTLDQLSRWEHQCTYFLFAVSGGFAM